MFVKSAENCIQAIDFGEINTDITLDCGQAFRWRKNADSSWTGVVSGIETTVKKADNGLCFYGISEQQFYDVFFDYFDLGRDYGEITDRLKKDEHLATAVREYGTIRILNQEPWETLCSFIFSACNNIPRIKGIIERFCMNFGEKTKSSYTFPSPERIAALTIDDMQVLRAGFRSPYILSAAKTVTQGQIDLESLKAKSTEQCEKELMKMDGIGKKVADCIILFSLKHPDAFPVDRHIKRIQDNFYPNGLPECTKGIEGIAQQYMFHMQRTGGAS